MNTSLVFKQPSPLAVALIEPQIPQNAGNITRLCACVGADLFFVGHLGFRLSDKLLDRAAMDYKKQVEPLHVNEFEAVLAAKPNYTPFYLSSKATKNLWEVDFPENSLLVFGSETTGLPEHFVKSQPEQALRIPMQEGLRSLNLASSVSIVVYETLRQYRLKGLV